MLLLRQERACLVATTHCDASLCEIACATNGGVVNAKARMCWASHIKYLQDGCISPESGSKCRKETTLADLPIYGEMEAEGIQSLLHVRPHLVQRWQWFREEARGAEDWACVPRPFRVHTGTRIIDDGVNRREKRLAEGGPQTLILTRRQPDLNHSMLGEIEAPFGMENIRQAGDELYLTFTERA